MQKITRQRTSRLDRVLDQRISKRLDSVNVQTERALTELVRRGVRVELFGSMARGEFRAHSDVDFLVNERGELSEDDVYNIVSDNMGGTPFDIVFAENLSQEAIALMRSDAKPR